MEVGTSLAAINYIIISFSSVTSWVFSPCRLQMCDGNNTKTDSALASTFYDVLLQTGMLTVVKLNVLFKLFALKI
jgi:uncharacterized membrane protein